MTTTKLYTHEIAHLCSVHDMRFNNTKESTNFYTFLRECLIEPALAFNAMMKKHEYATQEQLAKQRAMYGISEYSINDALQRSSQHPLMFAMSRCSDMQEALHRNNGINSRESYRQSLNVIKFILSNELDKQESRS